MSEFDLSTQTIFDAVSRRLLLRFNYHHYSRVVEPYALESDGAGNVILTAWQVSGGSECGDAVGMKRFRLGDIRGLTKLLEHFDPARPGFRLSPE